MPQQCLTLGMCPNDSKIIGYRGKATFVWASNTKISVTSKIATSPNEKLLDIG